MLHAAAVRMELDLHPRHLLCYTPEHGCTRVRMRARACSTASPRLTSFAAVLARAPAMPHAAAGHRLRVVRMLGMKLLPRLLCT